MSAVILIPTFLCIYALLRDTTANVFLKFFLPVFLLFPGYYFWKVPLLPPIHFSDSVLLPIGIAFAVVLVPRWRFSTMDLWLAIFLFSTFYPEYLIGDTTGGIFNLFTDLAVAGVPYMAGKAVIEQQGMRVAFVKRAVLCLFIACLISTYEYRMGQNPFTVMWRGFFPDEFSWRTQIRWGFGRVAGPFAQSEMAGIMFFFGLVLTLWVGGQKLWEKKFARAPWLPWSKGAILNGTLAFTLFMTQARGPWLGAMIALPIAFVGRTKSMTRNFFLMLAVLALAGGVIYTSLKSYAAADTAPQTNEQQTAQYRALLLDHYLPIAERGGAWGYGKDFPRVPGQTSIDNQYLFVTLTQGYVGLTAFCLIAIEATIRFAMAALSRGSRFDRSFAFTLMGIFVGVLVTIFTVFLGNQTFVLFFLLAGWSQGLLLTRRPNAAEPTQGAAPALQEESVAQAAMPRVYT